MPGRRDELHDKINRLDDPELRVVDRVVDAILTPVHQDLRAGSWLTTESWSDAFLARLRTHHALNPDPLSRTAYEGAFNSSCEAAGWQVVPAPSATHRFFDTTVVVPGRGRLNFSLKATSARDIKPTRIHISKLTEAAWIQDARTQAARRNKIVSLFTDYRRQTSSIIILRCFKDVPELLRYQLVEIPTSLFEPVKQLNVAQAQLSTIPIPPGSDTPHLRIRIDRSDAKITVTSIRIEVCEVHAYWEIPNLSGVRPEPNTLPS